MIKYYSAGAGSGKTYTLTQILTERLKGNVNPSEVILTTFTNIAAAEFRTKAREALVKDGQLDKAIELDSAAIGTVHSVGLNFVKKYWHLLNISPICDIISEDNQTSILNQMLTDVVKDEDTKKINQYKEVFDQTNIDWQKSIKEIISLCTYYEIKDIEQSKTLSQEYIKFIFNGGNLDTEMLKKFKKAHANVRSKETTNVAQNAITALNNIDIDINKLTFRNTIDIYNILQKIKSKTLSQMEKEENDFANGNIQRAIENALKCTEFANILIDYTNTLFDIAQRIRLQYQEKKQNELLIDFNDIELFFARLLDIPTVQDEIKQQYKLVMVDEFQDSNPIQLKIFNKLSLLIDENIWVGDQKQSIYGFRGTNPQLIQEATTQAGIEKDNLPESWRSRKNLVELSNKVFEKILAGTMPKDEKISLTPHWGEDSDLAPAVHHWHANCNKETSPTHVAQQIKAIFDATDRIKVKPKERDKEARPIEYKDIAILTSRNDERDLFISALLKAGVPVSSPETEIFQRAEVQLVISLLQYTIRKNKLSILNIEKLLGETPTKEIILTAIEQNDSIDTSNPLFKNIDYVVERIKNLPITYLVKNLILELNLHEIVKKWGDTFIRQQNLNTIISVAKQYDDECLQNGRGTSVSGFIKYLNSKTIKPNPDNVSNTVKVMTYHKSKGLEWPMVILASLSEKKIDPDLLIKKNICTENIIEIDNDLHIILFPQIVNTKKNQNIPTPIVDIITSIDKNNLFQTKKNEAINEAKRLLYVGFTRARDYIVTLSNTSRNNRDTLNWLVDLGVTDNGTNYENIWGVEGLKVEYLELNEADSTTSNTTYQTFDTEELSRSVRNPKFVSPSQIQYSANQEIEIEINDTEGERIKLYKANDKITEIGTCLHNIFAIYDFVGPNNFCDKAKDIIIKHNLMECMTDPNQIKESIEYLYSYLTKIYGKATSIEHEVPFYHKNGEQIVHGEIDLIWHTATGCILVDFKSFPGKIKDICDTNNPHYAGKYAPQLSAYKAAISAAGLNVVDSLIYYSVQGNIVKLNI